MKKKSDLSSIIGKHHFNAERHLKWRLSSSFWKDSNDFITRFAIVNENLPNESTTFLAKMYTDLLMCAECALKSLIISLSKKNETPEQAYLVARSNSHNLDKLYEETKQRAKRRIKLLSISEQKILSKANTLGVGYRYDATTFLLISQEDFWTREFNQGKVSSVINYDFIMMFYKMLFKLKKIADTSKDKYYGRDSGLSLMQLDRVKKRGKEFITNMKNKI